MSEYLLMQNLRPDAEERVLGLEDIRVLIFTCNRRDRPGKKDDKPVEHGEHYIYQTLSSLWMCDPRTARVAGIDLMIGDGHSNYLWWFYRHTDKIKYHEAPEGLNTGTNDEPHRKLIRNFARTLRFALETDQKGFLICEDDVVFADGFWDYALDAINEMRCTQLPKEANTLTLYSRHHYIGKKSFYRGRHFCSAAGDFTGLCGVYYDRECLQSLLDYLMDHETERPADYLYWAWSNKEWTRYGTPEGYVQHVGDISAGTSRGGYYWTDPRFGREGGPKCWDPVWEERPYERFFLRKD